ncbi:hypothetical protein EVAR_41826_1 [Eumeta japonica]|uniref:Uncharacterized protein n=1 Tax=Eumeta variegata TaxID=151549 RepID=A0A4C1X8P1_EUMVA|nr:hypothetical protein EVAR_41826_1 [Eumeta japonica]
MQNPQLFSSNFGITRKWFGGGARGAANMECENSPRHWLTYVNSEKTPESVCQKARECTGGTVIVKNSTYCILTRVSDIDPLAFGYDAMN